MECHLVHVIGRRVYRPMWCYTCVRTPTTVPPTNIELVLKQTKKQKCRTSDQPLGRWHSLCTWVCKTTACPLAVPAERQQGVRAARQYRISSPILVGRAEGQAGRECHDPNPNPGCLHGPMLAAPAARPWPRWWHCVCRRGMAAPVPAPTHTVHQSPRSTVSLREAGLLRNGGCAKT
jgi:hypothetical protein